MILRPFLSDNLGQYVFRPLDGRTDFTARNYRVGSKAAVRNLKAANSPYTHHGYQASIRHACEAAGVEIWSPGRLRHNAATTIRKEFADIEAARVVLGHASPSITAIYAEKDFEATREVVARIG